MWLWVCLMVGLTAWLHGHMLRSAALVLVGTMALVGGMLWLLLC